MTRFLFVVSYPMAFLRDHDGRLVSAKAGGADVMPMWSDGDAAMEFVELYELPFDVCAIDDARALDAILRQCEQSGIESIVVDPRSPDQHGLRMISIREWLYGPPPSDDGILRLHAGYG